MCPQEPIGHEQKKPCFEKRRQVLKADDGCAITPSAINALSIEIMSYLPGVFPNQDFFLISSSGWSDDFSGFDSFRACLRRLSFS